MVAPYGTNASAQAASQRSTQEMMRYGVPDIPKIAPIIEIKETYFHQKGNAFPGDPARPGP
jgi:hypothetical protein